MGAHVVGVDLGVRQRLDDLVFVGEGLGGVEGGVEGVMGGGKEGEGGFEGWWGVGLRGWGGLRGGGGWGGESG